jgi:stage II sporulation protein D
MHRTTKQARRRLVGASVATALLLLALLPFACVKPPQTVHPPSDATAPCGESRPARVLLVEDQPQATIACQGPYAIRPAGNERAAALDEGRALEPVAVRPTPGGLAIGSRELRCRELRVTTALDGALAVNGSRYRGELRVVRTGDGRLSILNVVPVEAYLYSVLGSETYPAWPAAALDAQAIVARSYALWRMADRRDQAFDLYATVMDQNYLGMAKEDPRVRAAVDRTANTVLLFRGKLFRCYYHSTCGGHTEAVENVFPDPRLLPLSGVPCVYCKDSKHYAWRTELTKAALAKALRREGVAVERLASLEVTARTPSGRAREVAVETGAGQRLVLPASDFRLKVGPRELRSVFFEIREVGGDRYEFRGRGFGHGVGLCQWGSRGMAAKGYSAAEILEHYYPGATLRRLDDGRESI